MPLIWLSLNNEVMKVGMIDKQELNDTAKAMAKYVSEERMDCHRGILPLDKQLHVLFGNDCYANDERSQAEANAVQEMSLRSCCPTSNIQTDESGLTWAIAVAGDKIVADDLFKVACQTWLEESLKKDASKNEGRDN